MVKASLVLFYFKKRWLGHMVREGVDVTIIKMVFFYLIDLC